MLYNVIGQIGGLRAHEDESVEMVIGCKSAGQENRGGMYSIINILKFVEMGKITWKRVFIE